MLTFDLDSGPAARRLAAGVEVEDSAGSGDGALSEDDTSDEGEGTIDLDEEENQPTAEDEDAPSDNVREL